MNDAAEMNEAARQRALMHALAQAWPTPVDGLRPLPGPGAQAGPEAGWQAYRRNALATARRALAAACPTVQQVLGDEALKALARDLWQVHPPFRGDLAWFGGELPALLAAQPAYAPLPWLPDLARLDWAVHQAGLAADGAPEVAGLTLLGEQDPHALQLVWAPGCVWLESAWPVEGLWRAHQGPADEARVQQARAALDAGRADAVWVQRAGLSVQVVREDVAMAARFNGLLWRGASLGSALDEVLAADPAFNFQAWLIATLRAGRLAAVQSLSPVA